MLLLADTPGGLRFSAVGKRSGSRAGWTPNFEWLGSGWRISILPRVLCVLSNEYYYLTHCLSIACIPLLSVQHSHSLYGNGGSRSSWQWCIQGGVQDLRSDGAFKFGVEAATKSLRRRRRERWRFKIFVSAILPCAHIYPLPVALSPALY